MESVLELNLPLDLLAIYCRRNGIRSLALFGSLLHGNAHSQSDIDLLVDYHPERKVGLFAIAQMEHELSDLLGRPVELLTAQDLSLYFRDKVLSEAQVLYAS